MPAPRMWVAARASADSVTDTSTAGVRTLSARRVRRDQVAAAIAAAFDLPPRLIAPDCREAWPS
ncbi:hypothetical protein [Streptomyces sp. NPDC053560]|uniref:hypothetical protein n=1 Tax=Streptomyces sp. NPDC053560 TaxID=3365711 RepID=UPI0037D8BA64